MECFKNCTILFLFKGDIQIKVVYNFSFMSVNHGILNFNYDERIIVTSIIRIV